MRESYPGGQAVDTMTTTNTPRYGHSIVGNPKRTTPPRAYLGRWWWVVLVVLVPRQDEPYIYPMCDPTKAFNASGQTPFTANNTFLTSSGNASFYCGSAHWPLAGAQAHGHDTGSTVGLAPPTAAIVASAKSLLLQGLRD